jgi:hypothetical protein
MRKIIITLCLALAALSGTAQNPLSFHAKAGIGTSYFHGKYTGRETKIAYKAGVGAEYILNRTWSLQSALEFVSIGGKKEIEYMGKADINEMYIQLPIMIAARLNLGKDYHASLSAGPYVAIGVGGKSSGEINDYASSSMSSSYRFKIDTFGSMIDGKMGNNRFDAGLAIGLTFDYRRFIIGAEVQVGFVTVNKQLNQMIQEEYGGYDKYLPKNFASFFTLGYRFW